MGERISDDELRQALEAATPGPWHMMPMQGPRKQTNFARVYATDDDLRYIADCRDFMCFHEITDNEANARLIALAPALAAEVLQLREALQPFAKEAGAWEDSAEQEQLVEPFPGYDGLVTVGDCRRARAALSTPSPVVAKEGE